MFQQQKLPNLFCLGSVGMKYSAVTFWLQRIYIQPLTESVAKIQKTPQFIDPPVGLWRRLPQRPVIGCEVKISPSLRRRCVRVFWMRVKPRLRWRTGSIVNAMQLDTINFSPNPPPPPPQYTTATSHPPFSKPNASAVQPRPTPFSPPPLSVKFAYGL